MNQDQVKQRLLQIRHQPEDFAVIFSGKKSKKVNGLYKAENREIILHNKNFATDNGLMYTAIHEFAHHLHFTSSPMPVSTRAHTVQFWSLFHSLLYEAEKLSLYNNPFERIEEFNELTRTIKEKFLAVNGRLMKELGGLLIKAQELCEKYNTSFTDYLDRILRFPRASASAIIKARILNIDSRIGFENMKTLTRIRNPEDIRAAEAALLEGKSPDMVKQQFAVVSTPDDPVEQLKAEKRSLERQIKRLHQKLEEIERRLGQLKQQPNQT